MFQWFKDFKELNLAQKLFFVAFIVVLIFFFAFHNHDTATIPAVDCQQYKPGKVINVHFTDTDFTPKRINATVCDTLHIINNGTVPHEPAIGAHPHHFEFPGYEPDHALEKDEAFDILLQHVGRFEFHDHIHDELKGELIIQPHA